MNKLRWAKWFWSDWSDDPALALCSLAAQGLWMRLLCIAAQGEPYGHIIVGGKVPTLEQLKDITKTKVRMREFRIALEELEHNGVAARAANGALVSKRMEHDGRIAKVRAAAARARWNGHDKDRVATNARPMLDQCSTNARPHAATDKAAKNRRKPPILL